MITEMAIEFSEFVHETCKEVPHDIGLRLSEIALKHLSEESRVVIRSCLYCKTQESCFAKDAVTHMLNETSLLKNFENEPYGNEIYSWNAEKCIEFEVINDTIFTG